MKKKIVIEKQKNTRSYTISAIVLLILFMAYWAIDKNQPSIEIPDYLEGNWTTTDPRYKDRFLVINKIILLLATGNDSSSEYYISHATKNMEDGREIFTLDCKNKKDEEYRFVFIYLPGNGGILSFKNQPEVKWTKSTL